MEQKIITAYAELNDWLKENSLDNTLLVCDGAVKLTKWLAWQPHNYVNVRNTRKRSKTMRFRPTLKSLVAFLSIAEAELAGRRILFFGDHEASSL